ncbi:glycosyltransferase family 2 protein, partial [bacterium]|nr:glycosyltransferase family 2 protein [bacterium]
MSEVKVSVIVPVYNGEKYLKECLDSLTSQSLNEFEAICVDDGSSDSSLEILKEYRAKDSRIKIIHQENQGVSTARNNALKQVSGEYITLLDCDDYIKQDALEIIYTTAKQRDCDILFFSYFNFSKFSLNRDERLIKFANIASDKNVDFCDCYEEVFNAPFQAWGKLYRTSLIKENNITFPKDIHCGEDRVFIVNAYIHSKSLSVLNVPLYYYRLDVSNSLSKSDANSVVHVFEASNIIKKMIKETSNLRNKREIYRAFLNNEAGILLYAWYAIYNVAKRSENIKYLKIVKKEYREFLHDEDFNLSRYERLKNAIKGYDKLFFRKLIEPFYEFEKRRGRRVLYIFERQVLNYSTRKIDKISQNIKYFWHLMRLSISSKFRKIKVGFWLFEIQRWTCQSLYDELKKSKYFEPYILLACPRNPLADVTYEVLMERNAQFFDER